MQSMMIKDAFFNLCDLFLNLWRVLPGTPPSDDTEWRLTILSLV